MQSNVQAQVPINPDMDARQLFDLLKCNFILFLYSSF